MSEHASRHRHPEIRSEKSDVRPSALLRFLLWLLFGTIAVFILMRWMFVTMADLEERRQPPPPVMKASSAHEAPLPRLQMHPAQDLTGYREAEDHILHGYGWLDEKAGIVHIDIDEAMRLTVERGLPLEGAPAPRPDAAGDGRKKK
jgi:hypothetical protein